MKKKMKKNNTIKKLIVLSLVIFLTNCSTDDDDVTDNSSVTPATPSIVEAALATPELSILVEALQAADGNLIDVINGGEFTVLAPTNDAFLTFLSTNGFSSLSDVPTDILSNILLNHVITGTIISADLIASESGYAKTNATNSDQDKLDIYFNATNGVTFNGVSSVSAADVMASNGVVHIVDSVIGLPTVVTFATADSTFETLVAALTRSDLTTDYVTILSSEDELSPFTVFAPTNDAFVSLLTETGISDLASIPLELLTNTLNTHVIPSLNARAENLTEGQVISTLGSNLTVSLSNGAQLIDENDRASNIIVTDVQAFNGVIHVIDKVVLPLLQ